MEKEDPLVAIPFGEQFSLWDPVVKHRIRHTHDTLHDKITTIFIKTVCREHSMYKDPLHAVIGFLNISSLMAWVRKYKSECIFLIETKMAKERMVEVSRCLGYDNMVCIPTIGLVGNFCLMWNGEVKINILNIDNSIREADVWDYQVGSMWKLYATYGTPYEEEEKNYLWNNLSLKLDTFCKARLVNLEISSYLC